MNRYQALTALNRSIAQCHRNAVLAAHLGSLSHLCQLTRRANALSRRARRLLLRRAA